MKTFFLSALLLCAAAFKVCADSSEETRLIAVLQSNASANEKEDACRRLKIIGTPASVPALAALLGDEHLYQSACDVLETMPVEDAGNALRGALKTARGNALLGVIQTLGKRRDVESVPALSPLLKSSDVEVACRAGRALGNIGGKDSERALESAQSSAPKAVRSAIADGLLQCAEQCAHNGEDALARKIYERLDKSTESDEVRCDAYAGLIRCDAKNSLKLVTKALRGKDRAHQLAALQLAAGIQDAGATKAYCALLPTSSPDLQVALLAVLLQRGDTAAVPAVLTQARSTNVPVRTAAITALGVLADAAVVPLLTEAATSHDEAEQRAARQALVALRHGEVTGALVAILSKASPDAQLEVIRALTVRADASAVPPLLEMMRSDSSKTRHAACQALGKLANEKHFKSLAQLLVAAANSETRDEIRGVFESIANRTEDATRPNVAPIATELTASAGETRVALLQVAALFADAQLRAAFRESLTNSDERVRIGAARALCNTRDPELASDLLELARSSSDANIHTLALEGFARLLSEADGKNFTPQKRTELVRQALPVAKRAEEKRVLLGSLAGAPCSEALELAAQSEADASVRAEAEMASTQIAKGLLGTDPGLGSATLARLGDHAATEQTRTLAKTTLKQFDSGWRFAGPYRRAGMRAQELFDVAFPPEQANATNKIVWRIARGSADLARPGEVDLSDVVEGANCVVYLRTRVFVPTAQATVLEIGSDDGIKLWLNGKLVHANNAIRGLKPAEDLAQVSLRAGWNDLLAKITQSDAGCGMMLRVAAADRSEIAGLKFDPRGGEREADAGRFKTLTLSDKFYAEGATFADLNRDGKPDVIAGPFWFEGPDFSKRHEYRAVKEFDPHVYSEHFLTFTSDFNGDGWFDIFVVPFPGAPGYWYENPAGKDGAWPQHLVYEMIGNESPALVDLDGDGRLDLIFNSEGQLGYATYDPAKPDAPWTFHAVSPKDRRFQRFTHGIGAGDINGDGKLDLLEAAGWWEQPTAATNSAPWSFHPFQFAEAASQMLVTDLDGDGLNDVICSWHCHRYGLNWFRQKRAASGVISWERHELMSSSPDLRVDELRFSELHAMTLADMNGDGLPDFVTGKRWWAHGPHGDMEPNAPAVLYWFELQRATNGEVNFIPHLIDDNSGVGTQVIATDANGDGKPDVVVANKKGIFVHLSQPVKP